MGFGCTNCKISQEIMGFGCTIGEISHESWVLVHCLQNFPGNNGLRVHHLQNLVPKFPRYSCVLVHYLQISQEIVGLCTVCKISREITGFGCTMCKICKEIMGLGARFAKIPQEIMGCRPGIMSFGGLHPFCCGFAPKYARTWGDFHTDPWKLQSIKGGF